MYHFLRYNARICASLGPWTLVVPVASTMLVLFALMATEALMRKHTPALVLELLGPLVMAFVGSSLLRPEYDYNTLETVLTRPVSFRAIVGVRMVFAGIGVLALLALLAHYMNDAMLKDFNVGSALLAAAISMTFLTALAAAVAAFSRSPTLGFLAAAVFWTLDLVFGGQLNPLFTLSGYAMSLRESTEGIFTAWQTGKVALVIATLLLLYVAARAGARPAGQWNLRRVARAAVCALLVVTVYLGGGAVHKLHWGLAHEDMLGSRSRAWYRLAFRCYGPLPVAPIMGLSFARFIGYRAPWTELPSDPTGVLGDERYYEQQQLKVVALGSSTGRWVDNALYDLGRSLMSDAGGPGDEGYRLGVRCLEELVRDHPDSPFAASGIEKLAWAYRQMNDTGAADDMVRKLVDEYPATDSAFRAGREFATRLREQHRLAEAIAILKPVAQNTSTSSRPLAFLLLGDLFADPQMRQADRAADAYEEAERISSEMISALRSLQNASANQVNELRDLNTLRTHVRAQLAALEGKTPAP